MKNDKYISTEFTNDPIKIHLTNVHNLQIIHTYTFIGDVSDNIKQELKKIELSYNNQNKFQYKNVEKFYGKLWRKKLGIINYTGGNDYISNTNTSNDTTNDTNTNTSNDTSNDTTNEGMNNEGINNNIDELNNIDNIGDIDELNNIDNIGDIGDIGEINNIDIGEIDIDEKEEISDQNNINIIPDMMDVIKSKQKINYNQNHKITFIFDLYLYPIDKVSELKLKIQYISNIPIYKQHIWVKFNGKSIPLNYSIIINNQFEYVDIENINNITDNIENIPININFYNNKDYIKIHAMDNMSLLHNYYDTYGITDYYFTDLSNIINEEIYKKISNLDRYKIELIYYGFVLIYFPIISLSVFIDYIKNEDEIKDLYPDIYPSNDILKYKFNKEKSIINEMYEIQSNKKLFNEINKELFTSITKSIIKIKNYTQENENIINLRNLFDLLELNDHKVFCITKLNYNGKNLTLKKTHYNEIYNDDTAFNSLLIHIKINPETIENLQFIIFKNGNYTVKTEWREENHMTFNDIINVLIEKINPILDFIDNNSNYIKYHNKKIERINKYNVIFTETSISYYYNKDITENKIQIVNDIINDYIKAEIIIMKDNINIKDDNKNIINEFYFNKGMYKYDISRIEKNIVLNNYYDYLTSSVIKQKWNTIFNKTRNLQIYHITSKLKFTISGIQDEFEMETFSLLLLTFIKIYENNINKYKFKEDKIKTKNILKNLKIQDPLLYDFKKIYKSNIVYSKICQKPYQPLLLTDDEYEKLDKEKKKNAVKYWNFTKEEPVWYSCPNLKYPYVKYIIKKHPKDFCIPCCKKIDISEKVNIKKQEIHNTCVKSHQYSGEKVNLTKATYYIMSYGKDVKLGHLSRLPENTLEPLLFNTYSPNGTIDPECISNEGYYLLGVQQNLPNINNIGYLSILLIALNYDLSTFINDCVHKIKNNKNIFSILLDGEISLYFNSYDELCNSILEIKSAKLIHNNIRHNNIRHNNIRHSSHNNINHNNIRHSNNHNHNLPWNDIFISISYYLYGINTIIFKDNNKENIDLIIKKNTTSLDLIFPMSHKNLIVVIKEKKYYPICLVNIEIYKRTSEIKNLLFLNDSGIISIIKSIVKKQFEIKFQVKEFIDIDIIDEFLKYNFNGIIKKYYINKSNLCYGLLINYMNKDLYLPIEETQYIMNEIEIKTDFKSIYEFDFMNLYKFIENYNKWVNKFYNGIYPNIIPEKWISVYKTNKIIGFISKNMNYYFNEIDSNKILKILYLPISLLLYHPNYINNLLIDNLSNQNSNLKIENKEMTKELNKSLYDYYIYQLIYLGFTEYFNNNKNIDIRRKMYKIITKSNLNKNTDELREIINNIEDNEDKIKLKNLTNQFIIINDKKLFIDILENTRFNFDKKELDELKDKSLSQIKLTLLKIANTFTVNAKLNYNTPMNNFITTCNNKKENLYCYNKKIIIDKKHLDNIIDIISNDIQNPLKWKWIFNPIFIDGVVNFLQFIKRPHETIYITYD